MAAGDAAEALLVRREGGVGIVTLNRPRQINAINDEIRHGLPSAMAQLDRAADVQVILLHGNGDRGFCAGADIRELREAETPLQAHRRHSLGAWIESVAAIQKPVIAAIHGACMGGGLELALACDIRIASPDARFALPEVKLGLIPGGGGTQRLTRTIGFGRALDLLITGEAFDAPEALRIGFVSRLSASRESLVEEALALAEQISALPPNAVRFAKESALAAVASDVAAGVKLERALFGLLLTSEDRAEAANAFREKRRAKFTGR